MTSRRLSISHFTCTSDFKKYGLEVLKICMHYDNFIFSSFCDYKLLQKSLCSINSKYFLFSLCSCISNENINNSVIVTFVINVKVPRCHVRINNRVLLSLLSEGALKELPDNVKACLDHAMKAAQVIVNFVIKNSMGHTLRIAIRRATMW